jgi:hypothetical protein
MYVATSLECDHITWSVLGCCLQVAAPVGHGQYGQVIVGTPTSFACCIKLDVRAAQLKDAEANSNGKALVLPV